MDHPREALGALPTEARNPVSEHLDELSTRDLLQVIQTEDAAATEAVRIALPAIARLLDAMAERFLQGGRIVYIGAGTSGRLGVLDASECPPTFSVAPDRFIGLIAGGDSALRRSSEGSEDSPEQGAHDLSAFHLEPRDSVLGIAASGRTPYVLGAMQAARAAGALVCALTCAAHPGDPARPASPMARAADLAVELATGPEVLTGSTRMKAGTATKMVLNMLSTGVMIRAGAVFGNLMVDVQPTNAKLADRAERIVAAATGLPQDQSAALLHESGMSVKTAILMARLSVDRTSAEQKLEQSAGRLRKAIEA